MCSVVLLPALKPAVLRWWSSPLVASISSVWSSAWLCLGDWWGLFFNSSGTATGCLSWEVWWLRTGSMGLAILLSAKSCCRLSWQRWLHPLHLLGPAKQILTKSSHARKKPLYIDNIIINNNKKHYHLLSFIHMICVVCNVTAFIYCLLLLSSVCRYCG